MADNRRHRRQGKILEWDWDWINSLSHENECPYYLTEREVGALLTFIDSMGWLTRWVSPTEQAVSLDFIQALRDGISDKLMRDDDCPSDPCEDGCIDYLPNSSFIRYEPNDPFRTPDMLPDGYTYIPWYTNPLIPLPGVIPTDAMVNQLAVLSPSLPVSGFPRFSFEFDGRGEIEIELVNVPAGGFCIVVLDESPFNIKVVNTSSNLLDILSIAGILAALGFDTEDANFVDTDIVEIDVPDVGHHRIDVTFLPNIGGETFLGYGGGLRRVTLCGPTQVVEEMYLQRQSPEDECLIEQSTDGGITWQEAWRMDNCGCNDGSDNPTRIVDGIIEESSDGGETWTPIDDDPRIIGITLPPREGGNPKCDAAQSTVEMINDHFDQLIADVNASAGLTALVAAVIALLALVVSLGTLAPLIVPLAAAIFAAGGTAMTAALTVGVYGELFCLIYCNSEDDGTFTEQGWQNLRSEINGTSEITGLARTLIRDYITLLGPVGLTNAGHYSASASGDCEDCECGCSEGCEPIVTTYLYSDAAWITHGALTRYSAGTPVDEFDSFTLAGTTAVLDIGAEKCITKVEVVQNNGCGPTAGADAELFVGGISQGVLNVADKVGCGVPSATWTFAGGIAGDQISVVQSGSACVGGHNNYLICVKVTTCV